MSMAARLLVAAYLAVPAESWWPFWATAYNQQKNKTVDIQPRIIGGKDASVSDYPYFVHSVDDELCGGTLINSDVVLTAAHCEAAFASYVLLGSSSLGRGETIPVKKVVTHPDYSPGPEENDIAVLLLDSPTSVKPVKLNADPNLPTHNRDVTVIGFGYTREEGEVSGKLKEVTVFAVAEKTCDQLLPDILFEETHLCAGVPGGGRDACSGDSGGPLLDAVTGVQYGIVTFGIGCAQPLIPGVYTRVSYYYDWIESFICENSQEPPESCSEAGGNQESEETNSPSGPPSELLSTSPSGASSPLPTAFTSNRPSSQPSVVPSEAPSLSPTGPPTQAPSPSPSRIPTIAPSTESNMPSLIPSVSPTNFPSYVPTDSPSATPTNIPTSSVNPSNSPSSLPSKIPSQVTNAITGVNGPTALPPNTPSSSLPPSSQNSEQPSPTPSARPTSIPRWELYHPTFALPPVVFPKPPSFFGKSEPSVSPSGQPSLLPSSIPSNPTTNAPTSLEHFNVTYVAIDACPHGSITALVMDAKGKPVVGNEVGFLLVGKDLNEYVGSASTDDSGHAKFHFTANDLDAGEALWCYMAVDDPNWLFGTQQARCNINVCNDPYPHDGDILPDCIPTVSPFDIGYGACDTYAETGQPTENYKYCGEDFDNNVKLFAYQVCTECRRCKGHKHPEEAAETLLVGEPTTSPASIPSSEVPSRPPSGQPSFLPSDSPADPPTNAPTIPQYYNVTYEVTDACPQGSITALVKDAQGQPVVGTDVGFLLVGNDSNEYAGSVATHTNGYAMFHFTASDLDAGKTLWCSMAVKNPGWLLGIQQEPCSIKVCDEPYHHLPECIRTVSPFNIGYGSCDTYADTDEPYDNHHYCEEDFDDRNKLFAYQVCAECLRCKKAKLENS